MIEIPDVVCIEDRRRDRDTGEDLGLATCPEFMMFWSVDNTKQECPFSLPRSMIHSSSEVQWHGDRGILRLIKSPETEYAYRRIMAVREHKTKRVRLARTNL